jgi:hypothetical protein
MDAELGDAALRRQEYLYAIDVHKPMAYYPLMIFIETSIFTRQVQELPADEDYANFQCGLAANPLAGDVIEGTNGLRKIRVAAKSKGKRGGARVIYYYVSDAAQIRLLLIYAKNRKDDLTGDEKRILRSLNERW